MSQDDSARIDSYLPVLRKLKDTSARRDVLEREIFLEMLVANSSRLTETPSLDTDRQNLVAAIALRGELHPAYEYYREWMSHFLVSLNQYEVANRTGARDQADQLLEDLTSHESLLAKCLQGYIILSGVVRDDFNDVIIRRFGETALADINELTHAGHSDDRYWKALIDRFATGFVSKSYPEVIEKDKVKLGREGSFVTVRYPLDAFMELMPGTDKEIDKTRLQSMFQTAGQDSKAIKSSMAAAAMLAGLQKPLLPGKASRQDLELLGKVAALDPLAESFVEIVVEGQPVPDEDLPRIPDADNPQRRAAMVEARKDFLKDQLTAMAVGAALALCNLREDLDKAVQDFTPRDRERIVATAGDFEPARLSSAHMLLMEIALCRLLEQKLSDEGGKVQVKCLRQRRASRQAIQAMAAKGFNRIRQKLFFEEDPASQEWFLFKARTPQELADALHMANMEPRLSQGVTSQWSLMEFKTEAVALVNLQLVAKTTPNVQAKLAEILSKLGVVKTA